MEEIDDDYIESTKIDMQNKLVTISQERQTLKTILSNLQIISLVEVADPIDTDINQTRKVMPEDPILKTEMTEDRRNEIYDKIKIDVSQL